MTELAQVNAKVDSDTKKAAEDILAKVGLTRTAAINAFYKQIIIHQGIPFELTMETPNQRLEELISHDTEDVKFKNLKQAMDYLDE